MKFTVNEILVSYIKDLRKDHKITVTAFSHKIGKSKSYITKFDNCEFKTITYEDFATMFTAISPTDAQLLMDEYFLSLIKNEHVEKNIDLSIDLYNYCNVMRPQKIPEQFVQKFNDMLKSKGLTVHDIVETANANEEVKHYSNFNQVPENEYCSLSVSDITKSNTSDDDNITGYIKVKLNEEDIQNILDGKTQESHYYILLAISNAYYMIDLRKSESKETKKDIYKISMIAASNLLFNFHVESLKDYYKLKHIDEQMDNLNHNLRNVSYSIQSILGGYIDLISKIYAQNYAYAERKVFGLDRNLKADAGFTIATMDLPFYKVKDLNQDNKKKLLKDIAKLIDNYSNDEDYKKQIDLI